MYRKRYGCTYIYIYIYAGVHIGTVAVWSRPQHTISSSHGSLSFLTLVQQPRLYLSSLSRCYQPSTRESTLGSVLMRRLSVNQPVQFKSKRRLLETTARLGSILGARRDKKGNLSSQKNSRKFRVMDNRQAGGDWTTNRWERNAPSIGKDRVREIVWLFSFFFFFF